MTTKRVFNDAFLFSFAFLIGKFQVKQGATAHAFSIMASAVKSTSIPFAAMILNAAGGIADQATQIHRTARYSNLSDLVPDHDPVSSSRVAEAIARRLTVTEADRLKAMKALRIDAKGAMTERLRALRAFIEARIGEYFTRGVMCDAGKLSNEQLLAYDDSKLCLEFILTGELAKGMGEMKMESYQDIDAIIKLVIEGAMKVPVVAKQVTKTRSKAMTAGIEKQNNKSPIEFPHLPPAPLEKNGIDGSRDSNINRESNIVNFGTLQGEVENLGKMVGEMRATHALHAPQVESMQKKLKSLEAKLKSDEERSTAVDHIFGNQMKAQSRLDAGNAVEAFYTGNTPFYQEMSRQIGLLTTEVLLLKENNAGQELYEASATMASTIPKKGKLTIPSPSGDKGAWEVLNKDESWRDPNDKQVILYEELGIMDPTHLVYLQTDDIKIIMGKLKTVPARIFAANFHHST